MNTFQCILASSQYESFVIFLYADIQWTSFGTLAGINSGNGYPTVTVPESQTLNILNIEETSNIGVPGVWMFKIGEGEYMCKYVHAIVVTQARRVHVRTMPQRRSACST